MRLSELYGEITEAMKKKGIEDVSYEASLILAHCLGMSRTEVLAHPELELLEKREIQKIRHITRQRIKDVPMAYLLGYRDFYRDRLFVSPGTLIPRPDTEHLVEAVINLGISPRRILEIGVGSGAILLSLSHIFQDAFFTGLDVRLKDARVNLADLIKQGRLELLRRNVFHWRAKEKYDLVVSNPPYLSDREMKVLPRGIKKYEPHRALYGGKDGLKFYRFFARKGREWLNPGGIMVVEVDTKWRAIADIFEDSRVKVLRVIRDYSDLERVMILRF